MHQFIVSLPRNLIQRSNMAKFILFFILWGVLLHPLHAQTTEPISFVHIGLEEGLSQSTIFDITQDKRGHMWFATYNGLNKYDGYSFTVYQHDEQNPNSIASDIVKTCTVDKQGRIWAGTDEGLSLYDAEKDLFENFAYKNNEEKHDIKGIVEFGEKQLLLQIDNKLALFDTETRQFLNNALPASLASITPSSLFQQGAYLYIGSKMGVFIYSPAQKTLKNILSEPLRDKQILSILQQSPTRLWIGTEGGGLFLMNPQTNELTNNYTNTPGGKGCISSNYVRSLAIDSQKRLWIGTIHSLNIYDEKSDSFSTHITTPMEYGNFSQTSVRNLFQDSQGGMWVGTYFGGLNYYHPLKNRFRNIQFIANRNSLNSNVIGCIREDSQKNLWIGTNGGGVNLYNPRSRTFTHYTRQEGLASNDIKTIHVDEEHDLIYIGTHTGGLSILHRASDRIETLSNKRVRNIYAIEPASNGEFWMGGMKMLLRFNPQQKKFTAITKLSDGKPFAQERISIIVRDSKRRLWIGGINGIDTYTDTDGKLLHAPILLNQSSVHRKSINCVYEAADGIFWIGTRSGAYRIDETKKEVKQYTTAQGLPNNVVHGILEDYYGKIWLSTEKGLSCFQPQTEEFRNYTDDDGLQSNQFTTNAHYRTANGQLYFGGINGIATFHPEQLVDNPYIPPVAITQLRLFNKPVRPGDDTSILEQNISTTRSITLAADQTMFSLDFVVSNYIAGTHNTFAYMLKGFDKEWNYTNTLRTVSYSHLPQGTYHFRVKAANNDGKWNEVPTELEIIVLPVWYKTGWALLLFVVAFLGATAFVFRYFWIRKSMKAQLLMERIDKERQKEVNEMKLRFFINISHELRTPLTLILAPLQEVLDKVNDRWIQKQLEHVQRNTNRLLHLVNQLMDYRRAELGVFHLTVQQHNVHQIIRKNFLFYERLAQRKKIQYNFCSEIEDKKVLCDSNYLELIVNNLLSNAFKYTGEGQSITVTLKEENHTLLLQIQDTGSGIPVDKQEKIFERFYQAESTHIGSGIGLSLVQRLVELYHGRIELDSAEDWGSTFSIYLPTDEASFKPEEVGTKTGIEEEKESHSVNVQDMYVVDTENKEEEEASDADNKKQEESILIVEDNLEILRYLSNELSKSFSVSEAKNGEEALERLKEQEIDLILTDVMMPVMDGLQLCKQVKQNLRTCHIPVIFLSAKADLKEQMDGLQVGADDYIPKPFSLALVTKKIKNMLRTRYRAIQHYAHSLAIEPEKMDLNPLDEELLKRAVATVEKHLDDTEFSTKEFASEMYMSRSNLHLKMKALTGESTNDFIRKIRFNHACQLLKEDRYLITEISTMVGFSTASYFTISFKKHFGCLPSEYTKNRGLQQD